MLTGITEVGTGVLSDILDHVIASGGNTMTFGPAGVGKTELAMQRVEVQGYEHVYLNLSVLEAPDLLGLPMIDEATKTATYAPPTIIPLYNPNKKPIVLLVDEVDKAKPELQNPMLELFQFRSMNGRRMNIHSVIATGNLPDENAHSQPVSHALTNRCLVYKVAPDFEAWQNWAASSGVNPLVVGFLSKNQNCLLQPPPAGDETAYCHPSPRAWTLAARDLDHTTSNHSVEFQHLLVAGRVGMDAAIKFKVWLEHYRFIEPHINALVANGTNPGSDATRDPSRTIVCAISAFNAMSQACRATGKDRAKQDAEIVRVTKNVCTWAKNLPSEVNVCAVKSTMTIQDIISNKLVKVPEFTQIFMQIRASLKD